MERQIFYWISKDQHWLKECFYQACKLILDVEGQIKSLCGEQSARRLHTCCAYLVYSNIIKIISNYLRTLQYMKQFFSEIIFYIFKEFLVNVTSWTLIPRMMKTRNRIWAVKNNRKPLMQRPKDTITLLTTEVWMHFRMKVNLLSIFSFQYLKQHSCLGF